MIKGVIFDLDGVLVTTDEFHYQAWKQLAEKLGIFNFTREDNERQRGVSRMESLEVVLEKGDKKYTKEEKIALAEEKNEIYRKMLESLSEKDILSGVVHTLDNLKKRGIGIAIGSASKNTPMILEKTKLENKVDQVSCGLDTAKSKPDPEVFLIAAKKLGLSPQECLVVEDSAAGIQAAKAGNMKSLGVGPYYKELGADVCARSLEEEINWDELLECV